LKVKTKPPGTQLKPAKSWRIENENCGQIGMSYQRRIIITQ
jgi:hypothetical protein